jgi:hypothetical protein
MLAVSAVAGLCGSGVALGAPRPTVRTDRACYRVGQMVRLVGSGFAPLRTFDVAIDGVDFGRAGTDVSGGFATSLRPGGLPAGVAQSVEQLSASDGTASASTRFTLTRQTGARFLASSGNPNTLRAPFEVWGFAADGGVLPVYLHYVGPSGRSRMTSALGRTGGQCGFLRTPPRRVFPFAPARGAWTFQLDTKRSYSRNPGPPVARIRVTVG